MDHLYTYFWGFQMSEVTIQDEKEKLQSLITQNMAQDNEKVYNSRSVVKRPLAKRPENGFLDRLLLNAGQKYCRMLPLEHSAILSTFIKPQVVIKTFVLSVYEWSIYTGFTVQCNVP